ncbi:peptide/nickel transport system ATP-binding protein [Muricomes intestini]|uniref:Peptide/nickel transport system ATP-binding protein n=1 Tax=Muricomes intestini TaxID=1796634 RepID=A0A4V2USE5_9FIRM|nr:ABC transporter ATP-binding protein [Muricomes intestini]TCS81112.1 peptide/nickel transport system ATP-binding protein [Muricomes intestini]
MSDIIMQIQNLKQYFPVNKKGEDGKPLFVKAVDDVSLDIKQGEVIGLVGESGSGKSTIAYSVVGMYRPTEGRILFEGKDLNSTKKRALEMKKNIQIVFQDPGSSMNPHQTIGEILELPLKIHKMCETKAEREEKIKELLEMVELPVSYMYKTPGAIGGGEKQMVAIARALACEPKFLILDEPTSALDVSIQAKIINMLLKIQKERNLTYLFITHDLSLMRNIATRVAILYLGKIAEIAPAEEFFYKPEHPYTQMLISSIPVVSEEEEALKPQKVESTGEIPSPVNTPPGCSFHLRCPYIMESCKTDDPVIQKIDDSHSVRCHLYE